MSINDNLKDRILDSIAEGVFTVDKDFKINFFNKAAEKITGQKREEVIGKFCKHVFKSPVCMSDCPIALVLRSKSNLNKTEKALELFYIVARIDINIIFNTDVVKDDCPCPELIPLIENHEKLNTNSLDYFLTMGILWAFCDKYRSLEFFSKAKELSPDNEIISSILNIFHNHFNDIEFVN
jgi:nitrogen-specific signal transduction histidine kinase